jgi:MSHA biogenesis protein MshE
MSAIDSIDRECPESEFEIEESRLDGGGKVPGFRIGDILLDRKLITEEQLQLVLQRQKSSGDRLGTCLLQMGLIGEEIIAQTLSEQYKIPYVNL